MNGIKTDYTSKAKDTLDKARRNKYIKFGLVLAAAGIGAYLGAKKPMAQIAGHVKHIDDEVTFVGQHVVDEVHYQQHFRRNQRQAIESGILEGKDFIHFPGVGVLDRGGLIAADAAQSKIAS